MSDDAPSLGGQSEDNAPMISSVQTRIIADARGAYLVGNLDALIDLLNHEQQMHFRRLIVHHAIEVIDVLTASADFGSDRWANVFAFQRSILDQTRHWLNNPGIEVRRGVFSVAANNFWGDPPSQNIAPLILNATVEPDLRDAAKSVRIALVNINWQPDQPDSGAQWRNLEAEARHWQVEAAWAILHDDPIAPLEFAP
jgi:hypothetical protein